MKHIKNKILKAIQNLEDILEDIEEDHCDVIYALTSETEAIIGVKDSSLVVRPIYGFPLEGVNSASIKVNFLRGIYLARTSFITATTEILLIKTNRPDLVQDLVLDPEDTESYAIKEIMLKILEIKGTQVIVISEEEKERYIKKIKGN